MGFNYTHHEIKLNQERETYVPGSNFSSFVLIGWFEKCIINLCSCPILVTHNEIKEKFSRETIEKIMLRIIISSSTFNIITLAFRKKNFPAISHFLV